MESKEVADESTTASTSRRRVRPTTAASRRHRAHGPPGSGRAPRRVHPPLSRPSPPAGRHADPRLELIRRVRRAIASGSYTTARKLSVAVDRLLADAVDAAPADLASLETTASV